MAESPVTDPASEYQGKTEKVTHGPQIAGLLKRVREQRVLLSVRVPGSEAVYNSLLLDVDPARNILLLDELNPSAGHELACKARQLRIRCQCQGVELSFVCPIEIGQTKNGVSFYRAPLPESISYLQRRGSYRIRIGLNMHISVALPVAGETRIEGELFDLSMGGLGANLPSRIELAHGQIIESCTLTLPNSEPLTTEIEIRFVRIDKANQSQRIGASFRNLSPQQQTQLRRIVTQLEREMLRRKARS
jgi:c-di-GMP-binding flagellar brake protein YcgR